LTVPGAEQYPCHARDHRPRCDTWFGSTPPPTGAAPEKNLPRICARPWLAVLFTDGDARRLGHGTSGNGVAIAKKKRRGRARCPFARGLAVVGCASQCSLVACRSTLVLRDARATMGGELVKVQGLHGQLVGPGPGVRRLHGPRCPAKRPWVAFVRRRVRVPPRPGSSDFQKRFSTQLYSPLQQPKDASVDSQRRTRGGDR